MLHLAEATRPDWIDEAKAQIGTVLLDHAHLEKKAASTALNLMFRYAHKGSLMRPLSELAREELEHFELMLGVLDARGLPFERIRPAPYAGRLMKAVRAEEPDRLLDTLLCCSLIEARSCERMKILAEGLDDPALAELYRSLLASEARHHTLYTDLATELYGRAAVRARLPVLAQHEAESLREPTFMTRMHS